MLSTQHPGLVVEFFITQQLRTLALSARSGDAAYTKPELDALTKLLADQIGPAAELVEQRSASTGSSDTHIRAVADPGVREQVAWAIDGDVQLAAVSDLRVRPVAAQTGTAYDDFQELNEHNNRGYSYVTVGVPDRREWPICGCLQQVELIRFWDSLNLNGADAAAARAMMFAILTGDTETLSFSPQAWRSA
jgi:hypothetical protein